MSFKKWLVFSSASLFVASINTVFAGTMGDVLAEPDWSGIYTGINLGGAIGSSNTKNNVTNWLHSGAGSIQDWAYNEANHNTFFPASGVIGAQIGYNWQKDRLILGLETNFDFMKQTNSNSQAVVDPSTVAGNGYNYVSTATLKTNWLYTIRPRVGYLFNHVMLYGTGGFALTDLNYSITTENDELAQFATAGVGNKANAQARVGWAAGAGIEWMFVPNRWTLSLQYLYTDFETLSGTQTVNNGVQVNGDTLFKQTATLSDNLITLRLNYLI